MQPTVYLASDHAGYEMKTMLHSFIAETLGYTVEDCGAFAYDPYDDYPTFVQNAARKVSEEPQSRRAIVLGGSGQGEAIAANRFKGVRAVVYYGTGGGTQRDQDGAELGMIASTRLHNDSNVLSLGARFITDDEAREVVGEWLKTAFSEDERHIRRIQMLDL